MSQNPAISLQPVNPQNNQQAPPQPKKKVRQTFTLKAEHFQKQNGFEALYKSICELDLDKGGDNVQLTMKNIVSVLKTWNFNMAPRYDFDYFLLRCKALGNHKFTQAYMSKVRKIHKGQDTWGSQIPQEADPLNNVDFDHLNPNQEGNNIPEQTLQQKIEKAMKLVNQVDSRQVKQNDDYTSQKMQIQRDEMKRFQEELQEDQQDQCEMLLKQMDELQKQKKNLFSKSKEQPKPTAQNNKAVQSQDQEIPYVPEGFQDMDYGQYSSQNY